MRVRGRLVDDEAPEDLTVGWGDYGKIVDWHKNNYWLYVCILSRRALWAVERRPHAEAALMSISRRVAERSITRSTAIETVQAIIECHNLVRHRLTIQLQHYTELDPDATIDAVFPSELLDDATLTIRDRRIELVATAEHGFEFEEVAGGRMVRQFDLDPDDSGRQ